MYKLFHAIFSEKLFLKNFCKQLFCIICTCNFLSQVFNENFVNFYHKFTWEYCRVHNFSAKIVHNQKVGVEALLVGPTKLHIKFFVHQKFKRRTAAMFHRTSYRRWARAASDGRAKRAKPKPFSGSKLAAGEALRRWAWGVAPLVGRSCRGQVEGDQRVDVDCGMRWGSYTERKMVENSGPTHVVVWSVIGSIARKKDSERL